LFFRPVAGLIDLTVRRPRVTLAIAAVLLFLVGSGLLRLEVDFNVESFFPRDDGYRVSFQRYLNTFGRDDDLIILLCQPKLGSTSALLPLRDLAAELRSHQAFQQVYSLFDVPVPQLIDGEEFRLPRLEHLLLASSTIDVERFSTLTASFPAHSPIPHNFYDPASETFILLLRLSAERADNRGRIEVVTWLRHWLSQSRFTDSFTCTLGGMPVARADGMILIEQDQRRLLPLALLVNLLVLWRLFGSVINVILVMVHVLLTLAVTLGCMGHLDWRFSILSSVVPVILIITSSSYSIHLLSRWRHAQAQQEPPTISCVFAAMFEPVGLATLTTLVGFLSLANANMQLITEFAYLTCLGVIVAFSLSFLLFPALVKVFPSPTDRRTSAAPAPRESHSRLLSRALTWITRFNRRRPRVILILLLAAGIVSIAVGTGVRVRAYVFDDFSSDSSFMRDIRQTEAVCDGILPMAVTIEPRGTETALRLSYLRQAATIARYLRHQPEVGKVDSPSDMLSDLYAMLLEQPQNDGTLLPDSDSELGHLIRLLLAQGTVDPGIRLVSRDLSALQVQFRLHDLESTKAAAFIDRLRDFLATVEQSNSRCALNGTTLMIQEAYRHILSNLTIGFLLVIGFTLLVFLVTFRHTATIAAAFFGNLFPVCLILSLMALREIPFKPSTITVFGIALGLAVDNTIYFLRECWRYLALGFSPGFASRHGLQRAGPGMIISSLTLGSGFLVLLFSDFEAQFLIGLLLSFSVATALIYDLFFVPSAMILFGPKRV